MSDRRGTPSSSQIIWLEQRVLELEAELARKTKVADAYWEIIGSYKDENAELLAAQDGGAANRLDKGGAD